MLNELVANPAKKEEQELFVLKRKCNLQVDKINELQQLLEQERKKITILESQIKKYGISEESNDVYNFNLKNVLIICLDSFFRTLQKVVDNNEFIAYKNYTKNSVRYCKVEKTIFDNYLDADPDININVDKKTFFNICVDFELLKADECRKYIWNDNQVRIYFINKTLVNILNGDYKYAE